MLSSSTCFRICFLMMSISWDFKVDVWRDWLREGKMLFRFSTFYAPETIWLRFFLILLIISRCCKKCKSSFFLISIESNLPERNLLDWILWMLSVLLLCLWLLIKDWMFESGFNLGFLLLR